MGITKNSLSFSVFGDKAAVFVDLAFSGDYAYGGVSLNPDQLLGLHTVEIALLEAQRGYSFVHDKANQKIKIFAAAPPVIYDEYHILDSSYQLQTNYPAAFFMNAASFETNIKFRSTGIAKADLNAGECCLASQIAGGEKTTLTVSPINEVTDAYSAIGTGTGWTAGTDWSFAGGKAVKAAGAASGTLTLDETFPIAGHTYRVVYTVSSWTAGSVTLMIGAKNGNTVAANGTYTEDILAVTSSEKLTFTPISDATALSIDEVYVYDLGVYVTYITQAWKEVWDNLVQDETITLATGNNTLGEVIATATDRTLTGGSTNWTNGDVNSFDETTDISVTASAVAQYFYLPVANAPTVVGTAYRLTLDVASLVSTWEIYDFSGNQLIATITHNGTAQTFDFTAQTEGGLKIVAVAADSGAAFDNFSLSPGNKILACMYVDQTTATAAALTMVDQDDTAASGEAVLKFGSPLNQINVHSAQNAKAAKITYVKKPSSGFLYDRAFTNETATKVGADPYLNTFAEPSLLWGYAGQLPVNGGTTQRMIYSPATPVAGQFTIDYFNGSNRGTPTTPTAAGASHNHVFTGTDPVGSLNLATPAFSGTGLTAAGQVVTTTDNQTMTLNQCAGMWLIPATGATPPVLILSNTAVTGAPAVLTVQGAAMTDAGAYKIVKSIAPVGTNAAEATHTHAITATSSKGTILDVKSNVTGTAAGVWGIPSEIATVPLEIITEKLPTLTSVKALFIGA